MTNLYGLTAVNIELTNRCNKNCWMCGRRGIEKDYPGETIDYGDMDFALLRRLAKQLPPNIVVQFHKDGESLLYPQFDKAIKLFSRQITNIVTNGKLIVKKAGEIIGNLDTLSISVFEKDKESEEQFKLIRKFLKLKGGNKPFTSVKLVGNVRAEKYEKLGIPIIKRVLHSPKGSFQYRKKTPTVPEIGICLDFLNHLCVNREGKVSICVRFDPKKLGVIGNANIQSIEEIWNGKKRMKWLRYHKQGKRHSIPLCKTCEFWGVPTST